MTDSSKSFYFLRRCAAELLAFASRDLFPDALLVGGDATDTGFYYDFIFKQPLHEQALTLLDVRLKALIKEEISIRSLEMMRENAQAMLAHQEQPYLADQAAEQDYNIVSLIQIQDFYDLCPPLPFTSSLELGAIKLLTHQESFHFLPDEDPLTVTRITGAASSDPYSLKKFLKGYEQLKKKDHRLLGPELNLWLDDSELSKVEPIWHPKGEWLKDFLLQYWRKECQKRGAQQIRTPCLLKDSHLKKEQPLACFSLEAEPYVLAAPQLKSYIHYFKALNPSKEDLPIRLAECAQVYEDQDPAQLRGFYRTYSHTTDRLVIFCTENQVIKEIISSLHFFEEIVRIFSFEVQWYWVASEGKGHKKPSTDWLAQVIQQLHLPHTKEENQETDKALREVQRLEMRLVDSLGGQWRGPFIEVIDKPLGMFYLDESQKRAPIVLITSLYDSLERFIALLIEQTAGILPLWLAPEQIRILAIGNQNQDYAKAVYESCLKQGFRVQVDVRPDRLAAKIHRAEKERVPYLLIVGDKEQEKQLVTVRTAQGKSEDKAIRLDEWFEKIREEIQAPLSEK